MTGFSFHDDVASHIFAGSTLNRHNNERRDTSFLRLILASSSARFVLFSSDLRIVVSGRSPSMQLNLLSRKVTLDILGGVSVSQARNILRGIGNGVALVSGDVIFLGELPPPQRGWCFAIKLPEMESGHLKEVMRRINAGVGPRARCRLANVQSAGMSLSASHSAIAAHGRSLFEFHRRHRFCGLCGAKTIAEQGGSRRRCSKNEDGDTKGKDVCAGVWFPRVDPVAIILVIDAEEDRCLLGRQERYPRGMYTCLAGFCEHAESLEDTARREVFEEAGVRVGRCRYHSSQPWAFPYSMMMGCIAEAVSTNITIDPHELQEARWFSRTEVQDMIEVSNEIASSGRNRRDGPELDPPPLYCPPPMAIAHQLLKSYANDDPITRFEPSDFQDRLDGASRL